MANAAATDSLASTLVPQSRRRMVENSPSDMEPSSDGPFHEHLHAGDDGRLGRPVAARRLGFHERQRFRKEAALPAMARLTAAATSVVDSMPCMVLCVTTQERQASSAKAFPE